MDTRGGNTVCTVYVLYIAAVRPPAQMERLKKENAEHAEYVSELHRKVIEAAARVGEAMARRGASNPIADATVRRAQDELASAHARLATARGRHGGGPLGRTVAASNKMKQQEQFVLPPIFREDISLSVLYFGKH